MDDLISRQGAIDALNKEIIKRRLLDDVNDGMLDEFDTEAILKNLPSAQQEQKKGKWIECERVGYTQFHPDYSSFYSVFRCTSCLKANYKKEKYCPNCGAEMEG